MYDRDTNQKNRMPGRGQQITGWMLERLRALILNTVKSGPGINVTRVGESVIVSLADGVKGGGGGIGGGGLGWYSAESKAELPNTGISQTSLGRVTTGAQVGMVCVRNAFNDGWDAINYFE